MEGQNNGAAIWLGVIGYDIPINAAN